MGVSSNQDVNSTTPGTSTSRPGARGRFRSAVDRRLTRMREGMPWARSANAKLVESYGSIVDLDLGWRMTDSALQQHQSGQIVLDDERYETLSALWETLTAEIIQMPDRDGPSSSNEVAEELTEAVHERLQKMSDEMRRDERATIRLTHDYETLIDLDLSWRMVEHTLAAAGRGEIELDRAREDALRDNWRELTTELVAILGRHQDEVSESPSQEALDNLFEFRQAA